MSTEQAGVPRPMSKRQRLSTGSARGERHPDLDEFDRALAEYEALVDADRAASRGPKHRVDDEPVTMPAHWDGPDEALVPPAGYWLGFVGRGDVRAMVGCWATFDEAVEKRATYGEDMQVYVTGRPTADHSPAEVNPGELIAAIATGAGYRLGVLTDGTIVLEPPVDQDCCAACEATATAEPLDGTQCADCGLVLDVLNRHQTVIPDPAGGLGFSVRFVCPEHYANPRLDA